MNTGPYLNSRTIGRADVGRVSHLRDIPFAGLEGRFGSCSGAAHLAELRDLLAIRARHSCASAVQASCSNLQVEVEVEVGTVERGALVDKVIRRGRQKHVYTMQVRQHTQLWDTNTVKYQRMRLPLPRRPTVDARDSIAFPD